MANDLAVQFEKAATDVQSLSKRPPENTLLQLYAWYKQAKEGNVSGARPGGLDFVGRAKYDAWAKMKGKSQEEAMKAYIALVDKLKKG